MSDDQSYLNTSLNRARSWMGSKRFYVYVYCVAISTFIWFLMKFSGSFTTQVPIQVKYIAPSEEWYVIDPESNITVDVRGFGFSLMWHKLSGDTEVEINLSNFEIKGLESDPFVVISTDYLINKVGQLFQEDESIDGLYPNILKVDLSPSLTKEVPIVSRVYLEAEKGYKINGGLGLEPESISIAGPAHLLEGIEEVYTHIDTIKGLREDRVMNIELDLDSLENWTEVETIKGRVDVDELTSAKVDILVDARTEDPNYLIKVLPTKVTVHYQVGLKDFELVNDQLFKASVVYTEALSQGQKLKVNIAEIPDFVEVTRISPAYVEYLLSEKK